jgi:integrase
MNAARGNRHGHRDATMVLVAYRHGLRAAELVDLRWDNKAKCDCKIPRNSAHAPGFIHVQTTFQTTSDAT